MRAFTRRGIEFEEVPMSPEDFDAFRSQGAMSAPIVDTGDLFWYGLRPDLIQEAANAVKSLGRSQRH